MHRLSFRSFFIRLTLACCVLAAAPVRAQDAANGALLYMGLPSGARSCFSCHGSDPGASPNNILRAAGNPAALTKALNTVGAMSFLRAELGDAEQADLAAFLATVAGQPAGAFTLWPLTMNFGAVIPGATSAAQFLFLRNPSAVALPLPEITTTGAPALVSHDCPATLTPGSRCRIRITMRPAQAGLARTAVRLRSPLALQASIAGASVLGSQTPVSALAWTAPLPPLRSEASRAPVRQTLRLANPGPMPAVVARIAVLGPQSQQFTLDGGCVAGSVLQAGTSCELGVSYTPSLKPPDLAVLQLLSDSGNPEAIALEGQAASVLPPAPVEVQAPPVAAAPPSAADELLASSGGGCSSRPVANKGKDASLVLMLAAFAAWWGASRWGRRTTRAISRPGSLRPAG